MNYNIRQISILKSTTRITRMFLFVVTNLFQQLKIHNATFFSVPSHVLPF